MFKSLNQAMFYLVVVAMASLSAHTLAEESQSYAEKNAADSSDKSGTNPVNFQRDIRVYNEYSWLNTEGDGNQNVTTLEYRQALFGGEWQFRTKVPYITSFKADFNDDGIDDLDESGLGDVNFRLLKKPWFKGAYALAPALEVFLDTASEDELGSGTTVLGPMVFVGYFFGSNPLPIPGYRGGGLFAPGFQYRFSVNEDKGRSEVEAIAIDINYLAMSENKTRYLFVNPQILLDQENDQDYAIFDIEFGWMMAKWFPDLKGHSFYVRPSFTVGADRPADYAIELGYKIVGW